VTILDDLIRHEPEHTSFDVKRSQYSRERHDDLLKDVMSMANAHTSSDRYVVCGVDGSDPNQRSWPGVPEAELTDAAVYQQLVHANIEPDIKLDYFPHHFEGVILGVVRIYGCTERPYAMRKTFKRLERGHLWIRKGSSQSPMVRGDLEQIYKERFASDGFAAVVRIGLSSDGQPVAERLAAAGTITLASDRAAAKIGAILRARRAPGSSYKPALWPTAYSIGGVGGAPYEERPTEELIADLEAVKQTYEAEDRYELYKLHSRMIQIMLFNEGSRSLEDARLDVSVPAVPGLWIAERIYRKPSVGLSGIDYNNVVLRSPGNTGYPEVDVRGSTARISVELGDLRHQVETAAFGVPLRMFIGPEAVGQTLKLFCTLHGKNRPQPITSTLSIEVVQPDD
jgi:hypothetical protein